MDRNTVVIITWMVTTAILVGSSYALGPFLLDVDDETGHFDIDSPSEGIYLYGGSGLRVNIKKKEEEEEKKVDLYTLIRFPAAEVNQAVK